MHSFNESLSEFGFSTGRSANARSTAAWQAHVLTFVDPGSVSGGVPVEQNEQYGEFLSYQAGFALPLAAGTRLTASAGRGIKEPTFFEVFASGVATGNPELDPERALAWEAGIEQASGSMARLTAVWFDRSFEDLIQYTFLPREPGDPNFFNVAAASARRIEVETDTAVGGVGLSASWTWLATEVLDARFDEEPAATFCRGGSPPPPAQTRGECRCTRPGREPDALGCRLSSGQRALRPELQRISG